MKKDNSLKIVVSKARRAGYKLRNSGNAGGWLNVAKACGLNVTSKKSARIKLMFMFMGHKPIEQAPVKIIYSTSKPKKTPIPYAATDAFLSSYEWRSLRMKVLEKYGARCQCCGATPADGVKMHVDHIKPRKLHPELALSFDNLQILCEVCNHGKGNWSQTDWRNNG